MAMIWKVEKFDGETSVGEFSAPGALSKAEVSRLLKQLYAQHLSPTEIISANLRKNMLGKSGLLDVLSDNNVLQVGENPFLTARKVET